MDSRKLSGRAMAGAACMSDASTGLRPVAASHEAALDLASFRLRPKQDIVSC